MPNKYVAKNSSPASVYTGSHAGIGVDSDDNRLYFNPDGTLRQVLTGGSGGDLTGTNTITAAQNGKTFFLNSGTEFVTTLPAPAAGLRYKFIVKAAPSGASYTIVTASSANIIVGAVHSSTGGNASSLGDGDTITFADGAAVAGDSAEVESDGTSWYARCFCDADAGITITKAS